jgi:hypothetical protein
MSFPSGFVILNLSFAKVKDLTNNSKAREILFAPLESG